MTTQTESKKARTSFWPVSRLSWLTVVSLMVPLGLQLLGFKLLKLYKLEPGISFGKVIGVVRSELLVLVGIGLVFMVLFHWTRGIWHKMARIFIHLSILSAFLLSGIEQGFFKTTGSLLEFRLLLYGLSNLGMLWELLESQLHVGNILLLSLPFVFSALPLILQRFAAVQRWLDADGSKPLTKVNHGLRWSWLLLLLPLLLPSHSLGEDNRVLEVSTFGRLLQGALLETANRQAQSRIKAGKPLFQIQKMRWVKTKKTKRMNVVLILLESVRASATSVYNKKLKTTPFLKKIAQNGLTIDRMFPVIPHTSKAVFSSHCGVYPKITMPIVEGLPGGVPGRCLPNLLRQQGYKTGFFQTATLTFEMRKQLARNMGFQEIHGRETIPQGKWEKINYFGWEDMAMLKPSMKFVDSAVKAGKPFFTSYLTMAPHHGYGTPTTFRKQTFIRGNHYYNRYLNAVHYLDGFLKKLFAEYKKRKLMDNTVFIIVGDHGEAFNEHKRWQHDNGLWDEIVHIPGIIYNPKLFPKGRRIVGNRQQIDIAPTVADVLGLDIKDGYFAGKSMLKEVSKNRKIFISCWYERYCMARIQGDHKVIFNYGRQPYKVYNLKTDPLETMSKFNTRNFTSAKLAPIRDDMLVWRKTVNASFEKYHKHMLTDVVSKTKPKVQYKADIDIGIYARLVGVNIKTRYYQPEGHLEITFVYQAKRKIPANWSLFFHLEHRNGSGMRNLDHVPAQGLYPETKWKPGEYIIDKYRYALESRFKMGSTLRLWMGMWARRKGRQRIYGPGAKRGRVHRNRYLVSEFFILPEKLLKRKVKFRKPVPVDTVSDVQFGKYVQLVGYRMKATGIGPRGKLDVTLVFRVLKAVPRPWRLFFHLRSKQSRKFVNLDHTPAYGRYPIHDWKEGDYIIDHIQKPLNSAFRKGQTMQLWIGMWARGKGRQPITGKGVTKTNVLRRGYKVFELPVR